MSSYAGEIARHPPHSNKLGGNDVRAYLGNNSQAETIAERSKYFLRELRGTGSEPAPIKLARVSIQENREWDHDEPASR